MSTYGGDIRPGSNIATITVQGIVTFNFRHVDTCNTKKKIGNIQRGTLIFYYMYWQKFDKYSEIWWVYYLNALNYNDPISDLKIY